MFGAHFIFFLSTNYTLGICNCNALQLNWLGWGRSHLGKAGIAGLVRDGWRSPDPHWHKHQPGKL